MLRVIDTAAVALLFLAAVPKLGGALAIALTLWVTWRWCYEAGDT